MTLLENILAGALIEILFLMNVYLAGRLWRNGRGTITEVNNITTENLTVNAKNPTILAPKKVEDNE